nr:Z-DNA-binding protein 1 isoform X2 [Cavia porcellus]
MAEAPADPSAGDQLEQKILQALRKAGSPMRTPLLVRECQVPKQQLNRVLYQMLKESKVSLVAPATWSLGGGDPGALVPAQPAQPSIAQKHQQDSAATSEGPGPQLSGLQDSGRRNLSATVVYQQNPINMIYQSQVSIANSEATQIGHGNVIVKQEKNGAVSPRRPPPVVPEDSWGPQNIHMERSMLRRVQVGHGNKMELLGVPSGGPACSPSRGPPVSATAAGADACFEAQVPEPGSHPEGHRVQRIRIKSCHLEDAAIGNRNKMTVSAGLASRSRAAESRAEGGGEPEPAQQPEDTGAPEAAGSRSHSPPEVVQAPPDSPLPTSELKTLTLGSLGVAETEPRL